MKNKLISDYETLIGEIEAEEYDLQQTEKFLSQIRSIINILPDIKELLSISQESLERVSSGLEDLEDKLLKIEEHYLEMIRQTSRYVERRPDQTVLVRKELKAKRIEAHLCLFSEMILFSVKHLSGGIINEGEQIKAAETVMELETALIELEALLIEIENGKSF